jgi:cation transport ATPase-like protein
MLTAVPRAQPDRSEAGPPPGLSSVEAARRLTEFGPNVVVEEQVRPLTRIARHFWAAKTCSTRERTRARVALPRLMCAGIGLPSRSSSVCSGIAVAFCGTARSCRCICSARENLGDESAGAALS